MGRFVLIISALHFFSSYGFAFASLPSRADSLVNACEQAPTDLEDAGFTESSLQDFLKENAVVKVNDIRESYVIQFAVEIRKFPTAPELYLAKNGGDFHILEGHGIGEDPSMGAFVKTFDGRTWMDVVGGGNEITRIVVNRLYEGHGSANVVLHERAHTLDIHGLPLHKSAFSKDPAWDDIMKHDVDFALVMNKVCGDYCMQNPNEAFAESFAMYFACPKTRDYLKDSPKVMNFMKKFTDGTYFPRNSSAAF